MAVLKNFAILEGRHLKGHFTRIGGHCRSFFLWILQTYIFIFWNCIDIHDVEIIVLEIFTSSFLFQLRGFLEK